jgi:hypothetical protein
MTRRPSPNTLWAVAILALFVACGVAFLILWAQR